MNTPEEIFQQQAQQKTHSQNINLASTLLARKKNTDHFSQLVESGIPKTSSRYLSILLNSDLVLSFLTAASVNEAKWISRIYREIFFAVHPRPESVFAGEFRGFIFNDGNDQLESLDSQSRLTISEVMTVVESRINRSQDGWQQDQLAKSITQSIVKTDSDTAGREKRRLFG